LATVPKAAFDLDTFLAMPRLVNLHVSPDGSRLALTIQTVAADAKRFAASIWEIRTDGASPPRRLTRSARGETARGFLPDGSLLFTSSRSDAEADDDHHPDGDVLYVLPAAGGEPRRVLAPPDGVGAVLTTPDSTTVVVTAALYPGAATFAEDEARQAARQDAGIEARLVEHYPERWWDHDIGPRQPHLFALELAGGDVEIPTARDLTPAPPWPGWLESDDLQFALSADGAGVAFGAAMHAGPRFKPDLATVATSTNGSAAGGVRVLVDTDREHGALAWSPDGSTIAVASNDLGEPSKPPRFHLSLVDAASGQSRPLAEDWEGQVAEVRWTRDGNALLVIADEHGHTPVFRIALDSTVTRLTASGAYRNLAVAPDGTTVYAIRSHITEPPVPVALQVSGADQTPRPLHSPVDASSVPARLEEISTTAADGVEVHSWLVLPEAPAAEPLPLVVFIHGGPVSSWAGWHWRWSSSLLAARGWAVLLPNPRLSTGYGHEHIARAWDDWATLPAGDIHAAVDAAAARPDIDADRTAAMGGSYGGYMANWMAVTTDRFRAIVTHASVWDLTLERDTSDAGLLMDREFGDPLQHEQTWKRQSPHLRVESITTPMLVIHGARDQRVPLGNSHHLWMELQARGLPSRMLLFPDENHWVLKPQNARIWYQTVFAFLDEHVLGATWVRPPLL
jgi:dipeptidyl aminopeptidase/acylaminoacyl peptidase